MKQYNLLRKSMVVAASCFMSVATLQSATAAVNLADTPVFLKESVDPNLLFIFDDSGSMAWEWMPDNISGDLQLINDPNGPIRWQNGRLRIGRFWYYSSEVNKIYYDPDTEYLPPFRPDGTGRYPNSPFLNAWRDGYAQTNPVNLSLRYPTTRFTYEDSAFYYRFNESDECRANPRNNNCYSLVFLRDESLQQQQNFANWYSYYSTRVFASRAGISEAFYDLPENIRVGYGAINSGERSIDGVDTRVLISGVRPYTAQRRQQFLGWLQGKSVSGGTPLRQALQAAGEYYSRADNRGPWGNQPGVNDTSSQVECRQSYTILMTDGVWNGNSPQVGNVDGTAGPSYTNPKEGGEDFSYRAVSPFADTHSNTLADVAMRYWKRDLRTDLANRVPTAGIDEAFWQHMTTFTVGLGVEGTVREADAFAAIESGAQINWPQPSADAGAANIDDLLHAAINGRGGFASAQNPEEFSREIGAFLDTVVARAQTSASAAAVSAAVLRTDTLGYFAGFRSEDWSGTLTAFDFETGNTIWDAERTLSEMDPAQRKIFTHNGSRAVALSNIQDLSATQQVALNADPDNAGLVDGLGQNRINWIRGSRTAHPTFRSRNFTPESGDPVTRLLGDIVNANPLFVGTPNYGYRRFPGTEGQTYGSFRSSSEYQNRKTVLYVAANDGMLHAFDSETGQELFAYMPGELLRQAPNTSYAQISSLISPNYTHRYFVDGTPVVSDAYIRVGSTTQWRSVLVGSMGVGGRSVFALDVTNPSNFSSDKVLWEFTHPDLGRGVTNAQIARLENGTWVAIFGNGYNGTDQAASLFVVNLATGALIKQIETGVGSASDSNGLSTPILTSFPTDDGLTRYAYAGDLHGNVWRFDLTGNNSNRWNATRLFSAVGPEGDRQPITSSLRITPNPSDFDELLVLFGTGSFIRNGDDSFDQIQSLYMVRDTLSDQNLTRDDLLEQTITQQRSVAVSRADGTGSNTFTIRDTSDNELTDEKGWYLDLSVDGARSGERVISIPTFPFGLTPTRVRFSTVIPDADPCSTGRTGFLMDLSITDGGAPDSPVFDLDSDGKFTNSGDVPPGGTNDGGPSGIQNGNGTQTTTIIDGGGRNEIVVNDPTRVDPDDPCKDGLCIKTLDDSIGRKTWEQLR